MVMLFHSVGLSVCSNPQKYLVYDHRCIVGSSETGLSGSRQVLEQVDSKLSSGDERAALSLVKDLQGKPGGLRCFGAARQVCVVKLNLIISMCESFLIESVLGIWCHNHQIFAYWIGLG